MPPSESGAAGGRLCQQKVNGKKREHHDRQGRDPPEHPPLSLPCHYLPCVNSANPFAFRCLQNNSLRAWVYSYDATTTPLKRPAVNRLPGSAVPLARGCCLWVVLNAWMAEGEGFEPPLPFRVKRFSRPPVSTAHTSLRMSVINSLPAPTASRNSPFCWYPRHPSAH